MRASLIFSSILAGLTIAPPSSAQTAPAAPASWIDDGKSLPQPKMADIGIPRVAGPLRLTQFTDTGSARDSIAQYRSADGRIEATIYLYENHAADALLAKIATDRVVEQRFAVAAGAGEITLLTQAGKPNAGLRSYYAAASAPPGSGLTGPTATASLFAQTLFTVIKIRVSGPGERSADILTALDSLAAGLEFRRMTTPLPISRSSLPLCSAPVEETVPAIAVDRRFPLDAATAAGMELIGGDPRASEALGREGCLVGPTGESGSMILRGMDRTGGNRIGLIGDSGTTVIVKAMPGLDEAGRPFLTLYSTRAAALFGPFDRMPTERQLASLTQGNAGWLGAPLAQISYDPAGNFNISINTARVQQAGAKAR